MNETAMRNEFQTAETLAPLAPTSPRRRWLSRLARRAVFGRLGRLEQGVLTIVDGDDCTTFGRPTGDCALQATITVHDPHVYTEVAFGGTVGAGDAYRRGLWSADDVTTVVRLFVLNRELLDGMEEGLARVITPVLKTWHWLHRNTKAGSRRNIAAHYDLGNEFFRFMLDETMMYSCAYFERPEATLADASRAKNDLICRKLRLSAADHLLEIGTGWGGFALHAASQYGCRVTTTTLSKQQHDLAVQRIREAGLSDRITVLMTDYRDLPALGQHFDKLVSIEMIEAIGHEHYETFFRICGRMLTPTGLMLIQGITIDERFYKRAIRSVDFIQQFIFPGSCIPSVSALVSASARSSDLELIHLEDIGLHYPPTLRAWRHNVNRALPQMRALGYNPEFLRLWEFYLCYCEGGFQERSIGTAHLLFSKPAWRPQPAAC